MISTSIDGAPSRTWLLVTTYPRVSMTMPDAVPRSRAVCTSMRTTDGPMACATLANARDSARASLGASVAGVT